MLTIKKMVPSFGLFCYRPSNFVVNILKLSPRSKYFSFDGHKYQNYSDSIFSHFHTELRAQTYTVCYIQYVEAT